MIGIYRIFVNMMHKYYLLLMPFFLVFTQVTAQKQQSLDSVENIKLCKVGLVSAGLIGIGLLANRSDFEQQFNIKLRNSVGNNFNFPIDDYMQYAPIAEIYVAGAFGVKAKNHWFDQTKYLIISQALSGGIVHLMKRTIYKLRPDASNGDSFPSWHTALSFTGAGVLYNEFRDTAPVLAYSGFAFAVTTGSFRMINNKHWFSDVLVGSGIGMLSAYLVYYFEPLKHFNPFKKVKHISFMPQIGISQYGFYAVYEF